MGKAKISKKPRRSSLKSKPVALKAHKVLGEPGIDREMIRKLVVKALFDDDLEMLKDVLLYHIRSRSKADLVRKSKLSRQTMYDLLSDKRDFNPSIKTLSALLKAIAA